MILQLCLHNNTKYKNRTADNKRFQEIQSQTFDYDRMNGCISRRKTGNREKFMVLKKKIQQSFSVQKKCIYNVIKNFK